MHQGLKFKVTTNTSFFDEQFGITEDIQKKVIESHNDVIANKKGIIRKLNKYVQEYPDIPHFKNYLSVAYINNKNEKKAWEVNDQLLEQYPDYLFGKINLANKYIIENRYEKLPEILGEDFDLKKLYPERDEFHEVEFLSLSLIAIQYFLHVGNIDEAMNRFEAMNEINDESEKTEIAAKLIIQYNLEKGLELLNGEAENLRLVEGKEYDKSVQTTDRMKYNHSQIEYLYNNDFEIDTAIVNEILSLPRETLIKDLENVMFDSVYRYEYFYRKAEGNEWNEKESYFPIHALLLLSELKAEQSLPVLLYCLRQGDEYLDFWFGDLVTEYLYEPLYKLANNDLGSLKEFLFEPDLYVFARCSASTVASQIVLHEPQRRDEVITWYKDVINYFLDNISDEHIIDSELLGYIISDITDFNGKELLDEIKKLYKTGIVDESICGSLADIKKDIRSKPKDYCKRDLLNIYERYEYLKKNYMGDVDEDEDDEDDEDDDDESLDEYEGNYDEDDEYYGEDEKYYERELRNYDDWGKDSELKPIKSDPKIGRTDPCPCGSGKKYKKCCMNKI